ncbi:MAG: hypothetical protein L0Z62_32980 [Gemmataceae bacterium]|nr:hypothetical protein [Gemmataceae bacterium]
MLRLCSLIGCAVILIAFTMGAGRSGDTKKEQPKGKKQFQIPQGWGKLKLSADQKSKIYAVRADYSAKIEALNAQIEKLKDQEFREMVKVLTEAQKDQLRKPFTDKGFDTDKKGAKDKAPTDKKSSTDKKPSTDK